MSNLLPRRTMNGGAEHCSTAPQKCILVTGGAGYIGSHTALQLLLKGYKVVIVDSLENSVEEAVKRVRELAGKVARNLYFYRVNICEREALEKVFQAYKFDAVIHFAGFKAVGESVLQPLKYYTNNITGALNLFQLMSDHGCKKLVFSSSATVYGQPKVVPCTEDSPLQTASPYGRTKLIVEEIARDMHSADSAWNIILLRYFNPVAAHPSGRIGEDPQGVPNNLMPFVQQVAVGRRPELLIFGSDYPTRDGTGVRDYIHVMDLATGHSAALDKIFASSYFGCDVYNLGTGRGTSVLEMVTAFEKASGVRIPIRMSNRRAGDIDEVFAATSKAEKELGWKAQFDIEDMCRDQWNWVSKNPWGYQGFQIMKDTDPQPCSPRKIQDVSLPKPITI
eukprot:TRINITY_DN2925_c0_g2_i1.p1 TRINITY_DN2925_c0_g2~~TRINITY_DN2925_c0_g2_i1.p1  ORF type:complete len:393 (-),score=54.37 TRINITY_DN2925_c0_g2_i1:427-1605(-)